MSGIRRSRRRSETLGLGVMVFAVHNDCLVGFSGLLETV